MDRSQVLDELPEPHDAVSRRTAQAALHGIPGRLAHDEVRIAAIPALFNALFSQFYPTRAGYERRAP